MFKMFYGVATGAGVWPCLWIGLALTFGAGNDRCHGAADEAVPTLRLLSQDRRWPGRVDMSPRPAADAEHVPLRTSFYTLIASSDGADRILPDSVTIQLQTEGKKAVDVLEANQRFGAGYSGEFSTPSANRFGAALVVFVEATEPLEPQTRYTLRMQAHSERSGKLSEDEGTWQFTTEQLPATHGIEYRLDLAGPPDVKWLGEFFNGIARPSFATGTIGRAAHYELIADARKAFPHAWNLHRDAYLAGFEYQPTWFKAYPNIVRERETRRIAAIERRDNGVLLHVEDFFGHQQYGIDSDRPLGGDYRAGDEILIADGFHDARAHVIATDDQARTVLLTPFDDPPQPWRIEYAGPLPTRQNPEAPGLFPPGGTYLRKFDPPGTAHYYWGRLDHAWDTMHGEYGFRLIPRFAGAPGDLAIDGRSGTTAKDLAQLHEVTRAIASHIIQRYGAATLDWPWVVLNEPDLMNLYWRNRDWEELQRFYDYTSDAILRAFEDQGYESSRVRVGGLELGAIAGLRMRLEEFLTHVSPHATGNGALEFNAAYADPRLDGKRSRRVEELCGANEGRGAPFDFLSIHTYNDSEMAAAKLIRAKEVALQIDPAYFKKLAIVNHETVPTWQPIADPGAAEMYLGNGYFPTWAANLMARLLQRGASDARFAYGGESPLMVWPGMAYNFDTLNDVVRQIRVADRTEVLPSPIFHFVNLLSTMREDFYVLPPREIGGHVLAGFASRTEGDLRVLVYSHHVQDTQSRSDIAFEIDLKLTGLRWDAVEVERYRFDRSHNSYYELARELRQRPGLPRQQVYSEQEFASVAEQAELRVTRRSMHESEECGAIRLTAKLAGNGGNFLIVRRAR